MAVKNSLIMNLLRIITPEEIADIATKHNGGKFLSMTELVNERFEKKIHRNFSDEASIDEIFEAHAQTREQQEGTSAKILPFGREKKSEEEEVIIETKTAEPEEIKEHEQKREGENMSSFILMEKDRLKKSQKSLKQKEIIDLYRKNSHVDVEQIKNINQGENASSEAGVLVNKKQY